MVWACAAKRRQWLGEEMYRIWGGDSGPRGRPKGTWRQVVKKIAKHVIWTGRMLWIVVDGTRRPASADRTARRQFQATGQPVSRTQATGAMTSRLPRYEVKCVQRRCFQCGSVPLHSDTKGTKLPPANILIPLERQLIALQLCRWQFLYNKTLQQTFRPLFSKLSKRRQI